jgi:hypothetical protein
MREIGALIVFCAIIEIGVITKNLDAQAGCVIEVGKDFLAATGDDRDILHERRYDQKR